MLQDNKIKEIKKLVQDYSNDSNPLQQYRKIILFRRVTEFIMVTILQYASLSLGQLKDITMLLSPAIGVAIAILFLRGHRALPGIFIGCLLASLHAELTYPLALFISLLLTASAFSTRFTALKIIGPIIPIAHLKIWGAFLGLVITFSLMTVSVLYYGLNLYYHLTFELSIFIKVLLSYLLGTLIFTPIALISDTFIPEPHKITNDSKAFIYHCCIIYGFLIIINLLTCFSSTVNGVLLGCLSTLPLTVIATVKFRQYGPLISVLISGMILMMYSDMNSFAKLIADYPLLLIAIQIKLLCELLIFFSIATFWQERQVFSKPSR